MQTFDWYYRRLRAMSTGEIAWRMRSSVRDHADRFLVRRRQRERKPSVILNGDGRDKGPGFRVSDIAVGSGEDKKVRREEGGNRYDSMTVGRCKDRKKRGVVRFFDGQDGANR